MIILGIDPGIATTGYGVIELQVTSYKLLIMVVLKLHLNFLFQKDY